MASTEPNVDIDKEEPKWNAEDCDGPAFGSPPAPLCNKPLDFSQVTPSQLGISTQSFVPSSLGKDKSRLTQLKARRRSTVGARGSPETNSLIRYIAQQRQKTPPSTPQPVQASPLLSRGFSSLKQKMASFQNLLEVEENQGPAEEREADGRTSVGGKENRGPQGGPRPAAPPSSKKRRMSPFREIVMETREATPSADILSPLFAPGCPEQVEARQACSVQEELRQVCSEQTEELQVEQLQVELRQVCSEQVEELQVELRQVCSEQEEELQVELRQVCSEQVEELQVELRQVCSEEPRYTELTSCEMEEAVCCSPRQSPVPWSWDHDDAPFTSTHGPPTEARRTPLTEPLSPCMLLNLGPADTGSNESPFPLTAHPTEEGPDCAANSARPKKKRVHFGVPLSPEFFDKRLPPSTPLQKGGTPAHPSASGGRSGLRSLLKTPQKSALSLPQPDFGSPSLSGPSSPPPSVRHGDEEEQGQLAVPAPDSVEEEEEEEEALGSREDAACSPDVAPVRRQARSPDATPVPPPTPSGEAETGEELKTELAPAPSPAPGPPVSAARPGRPRGRKRKQAEGTDAAAGRRPSRSAAVAASGKMKTKGSAGKRGWGSKAVDRSLYGKRDYASKNPVLSPITESLPCASRSPTPLRHGAAEQLPEDCRETRNPSIPLAQTGPSGPVAGLVTAAGLWRSRFGVPARDQAPNDRPDDHEATNDRPDDHEASDDRPDDHEASNDRPGDHEASNDRPDDHKAEEDAGCSADDPSDCAAEAASTASVLSQERRGRRLGRPRGGRGGRGKGRREPALSDRNCDDQTLPAVEPELPVCSPAGHDRFPGDRFPGDRFPGDRQESDSGGLKVEEERHGDGHGAGDSVTSEPDAGGGAPEPVSGGGRRSSGSRRSGAKGRPKGRRSSLYRPPPLTEEDEEAQSPQTLPLPGGEQSEGEGAVRGGEGGEISDTATERKGEEGSGETGGDGIGPPAVPPTDGADGAAVAPPPWQQAEFCIEDVLQAPPRGGRRSVRRSLRNQSLQDPSATGLAWVPSSSPTDRRPARRRTRGRRSSAHAPPTLPEDASPPEARC
ncbi:cell division cycle-associated protein 2 [Anguilla anguilla]|uniref:cell division cycle-associated protein 2 n=1 Tax=Anguilla anguilla TaxID=7936 RepID=UPI0015AD04E6|nr:cell division cycle-associated protein 2 [Anguilla anguilla]